MIRLIAILILLVCACAQAKAQDTGNSMIDGCKSVLSGSQNGQSGYCLGALTMMGMVSPFIDEQFAFCSPKNATGLQVVRIVVRYMDDHPAELDRPFSFIALHALQEAWPCNLPKKPGSAK
jgi:hypothetical protein